MHNTALRVAFLPEQVINAGNSVCIVLDVLRATTCMAVLFSRRCPRIYASDSHEKARAFARPRGFALCGEVGGLRVEGFDFGNSPVEFTSNDFLGKPVTLSTTNGTKAIARISEAPCVLAGAAVNMQAAATAAWMAAQETDRDITLVCSGTDEYFTLEDAVVAGMYVERLQSFSSVQQPVTITDSALAAMRLAASPSGLLRNIMEGYHAQKLCDLGFGADVEYCAQVDILHNAPVLVTERYADQVEAPLLLAV